MTQTLELHHLKLSPLTASENKEASGGFIWAALGVALLVSAINDFGDIRQGLVDGYNGTPSY